LDVVLKTSLKKRFPFRLATTSFIYPGTWADNVRRLALLVDEIELLFFESSPRSLPTRRDIGTLAQLGRDLEVGYNVHLPTDISLGDSSTCRRHEATERLIRLIDRCAPLTPSSFTLHLPIDGQPIGGAGLNLWQKRCGRGLQRILRGGLSSRLLAVETLTSPDFSSTLPLVADGDLSICLDMGHLLLRGQDPVKFYRKLRERIPIIHLHGVKNGRDHLGLESLNRARLDAIMAALDSFTGTVSLEVFSVDHLMTSLECMGLAQP